MLCSSKAQQQAECPWVTSPHTLSSSLSSLSLYLSLALSLSLSHSFSWMSVSPLAHYLKSFHRNILHAPDFAALQSPAGFSTLPAMFWCLFVRTVSVFICVCVCTTASYLRCLSRVEGKWGWPRLDSNNYLGHVCVPHAIIAGSASWDYMHAACAHTCTCLHTHTHTHTQLNKHMYTLSWRLRAALHPSVLGRSFMWLICIIWESKWMSRFFKEVTMSVSL